MLALRSRRLVMLLDPDYAPARSVRRRRWPRARRRRRARGRRRAAGRRRAGATPRARPRRALHLAARDPVAVIFALDHGDVRAALAACPHEHALSRGSGAYVRRMYHGEIAQRCALQLPRC